MSGRDEFRPLRRLLAPLLLFRLASTRLDALLTAMVVGALAWSRFALLASGPWEWDEVLFARGLLAFDLAAHFPHPPGFPGWLAIGHMLRPLAREPLHALQLASAGLSVVAVWPLASLGRRVAPPPVALAAALLVLFAPGPWLHAVRGFSSTPATTLALLAAALAAGGLSGRRATWFSVLVAAAFLIRPILFPGLAVLWLGGAASVRPLRRLAPGVAIAVASAAVSVAAMVHASGGWREFIEPFTRHAGRHFSRLGDAAGGWPELGMVTGLGGSSWAIAFAVAAAFGLAVWGRRRGVRSAVLWAVVLAVVTVQLVVLQNRTYPRYAVVIQLGLAPLVAGAAALAPAPVAAAGLALAALTLGHRGYPLLVEQHTTELPGWSAVRAAAREASARGSTVVVEPELHPFASYLWHVLSDRGVTPPPLVLSPWAPEPWSGVGGHYLVATVHRHHYPASLVGGEQRWGGVSPELVRLTQRRFLEAWVVNDPPLPLDGWWPVERLPDGNGFMWGGRDCDLLLPPLPDPTAIVAVFRPAPGGAPLEAAWNGEPWLEVDGDAGPTLLRVAAQHVSDAGPNTLGFRRSVGYPPGTADPRPLAVQLLGIRVSSPDLPWHGSLLTATDRALIGARLVGHYEPESFGDAGPGIWLEPNASLEVQGGPGRLLLTMWAPRPTPSGTLLRLAGGAVTEPLDLPPTPTEVEIEIGPGDSDGGRIVLDISSAGYVPAEAGHSADRRALGVVVSSIRFEPVRPPSWAGPLAPRASWPTALDGGRGRP